MKKPIVSKLTHLPNFIIEQALSTKQLLKLYTMKTPKHQKPFNCALAALFLIFYWGYAKAQQNLQNTQVTFVNKVSETIIGQTDTVPIALISKVATNYVVSSNQKISATQNDIKTVGLTTNMAALWQQFFNVSNRKAFTTATATDAQGNYYVAGSTYINALNGQDLTVIKYNSLGIQQWVRQYNGPGMVGNNYDIASGIVVDNAGNVFVTGASVGSLASLVDYVTIKYNAQGTQQWVSRYNFANGLDIPSDIVLDNAGNPVVSGSSASSAANTNLDVTTIKYNTQTGTQVMVQKQANAGTGQDKVLAQTRDNLGNIYVTGGTTSNGVDYDVQTIKYDVNMNPVWVKTYDGFGKSDFGNDIAVDNNGNVIITGYVTQANLEKQLLVISYSPLGAVNWKVQQQLNNSGDAEGIKVKIKNTNEIFIGANYIANTNANMAILRFDNTGHKSIEKTYNSAGNFNDRLLDLMIDGNTIVVSGQQNNGSINQNMVVKYEYKEFTRVPTTVGTGITAVEFVSNEIIVAFSKQVMKMNAINTTEFTFGKLNDFVQDSTVKKMITALDPKGELKLETTGLTARKIYIGLTEKDSLSLSRLGDYVRVPEFYTSLLISLPQGLSAQIAAQAVSNIKPDIKVGQLNHIGHINSSNSIANDPLYASGQPNLHPTANFPLANINVDSAWAITTGVPSIKLGILDTGVQPGHQDLPGNIQGFNFTSQLPVGSGDYQNHGTKIAGVIAAKRNNNIGIAGIAGGDATQNNFGVTIYDCQVCDTLGTCTESDCSAGIVRSVKGTNINGFGLHIINCSWFIIASYYASTFGHGLFQQMVDALNFANRNGVTMVISKTNFNNLPLYAFPADWTDETMMSVGSSGNNGEYCIIPANCSIGSSKGGFIDFLAPGSDDIILTTANNLNYDVFKGTSAAASHVSASSALLMSYWNNPSPNWNNLLSADCEQILQRTALDLVDTSFKQIIGYDSASGWGRINVYQALKALDKTKHRILHISEGIGNAGVSSPTITLVHTGNMFWKGYSNLAMGNYATEIYERKVKISYNLLATEQIKGVWPMNKECYGAKLDTSYIDPDRPHYADITNATQNSAVLTTYFYKIPALGISMPTASTAVRSALTLYTYDPTGAIGVKEHSQTLALGFRVFPNPSKGLFKCVAEATKNTNFKLEVINLLGQIVLSKNWKVEIGYNEVNIDLLEVVDGLYTLKISNNNVLLDTHKLIKN
jgi:hypothetical protein